MKYLILGISLFILSSCSNEEVVIHDINCSEVINYIDDAYLIDVRTVEEYNEGHLDSSINIPLDEISSITDVVSDKNSMIIVYCRSGVRSLEAANELLELGYTNIYDMGGINDC